MFIIVLASTDYESLPEIHVSPSGFAPDRHFLGNSGVKCDSVLSSPSECESRRCTPATMMDINTTPINFTFEHLILRHRSVTHEGILRTKRSRCSCSATSVLSVSHDQPITALPGRGTRRRRAAWLHSFGFHFSARARYPRYILNSFLENKIRVFIVGPGSANFDTLTSYKYILQNIVFIEISNYCCSSFAK